MNNIEPFVAIEHDFLQFDDIRHSFSWAGIELDFQEFGYGVYTDKYGIPLEGYIAVFWDKKKGRPKQFIEGIKVDEKCDDLSSTQEQ